MTLMSFLTTADHLAAVVVIASMLCVSVLAYRRTRMSAFLYLICGSLVFAVLAALFGLYKPASKESAAVLMEWGHVGHFAATIFCGIGIVQLAQHARRQFQRKSP